MGSESRAHKLVTLGTNCKLCLFEKLGELDPPLGRSVLEHRYVLRLALGLCLGNLGLALVLNLLDSVAYLEVRLICCLESLLCTLGLCPLIRVLPVCEQGNKRGRGQKGKALKLVKLEDTFGARTAAISWNWMFFASLRFPVVSTLERTSI